MFKKKTFLLGVVIAILLLAGSQVFISGAGGLDSDSSIARANEAEVVNLYVPLIARNYPPPPTAFGIDFGAIQEANGLNKLVDAGASWVRRDGIDWASVEPTKGARNWSALASLESDILNAQQNHLEPIIIVSGAPEWARKYPTYACGPIKETELGSFASFMKDVVSRYSQSPYNVKYWEIWNEPDATYVGIGDPLSRFGCWGEGSDPYFGGGYYGQMLSVVTPQMKAANPNVKIVVGGLLLDCDPINPPIVPGTQDVKYCAMSLFLEGILRAGGGAYFDGISFHAYDYYAGELGRFSNVNWNSAWNTTGPVVSAKVNYLRSLLNNPDFGAPGKFLMNTEAALVCGSPLDPPGLPPCDSEPTSAFELTKAYYLTKVFTVDQSLGLLNSIWYNVFGWRNSGLLNKSDLSERPAYKAYSVASDAIGTAQFQQKITSYPGVEVYEFVNGNGLVWVLWSQDGSTHTIDLGGVPKAGYDTLGQAFTPSQTLEVGLKPIYLEW